MKTNLKRFFRIENYRRIKLFSIAIFCALAVTVGSLPAAQADEWYVDNGTVPSPRDGLDWDSAYATIQEALDNPGFVAGDEIWVKAGTYTIASTIYVLENAGIYGGFAGTETLRSQRNWETNLTTLDGVDLIDHVIFIDNPATVATIDGFTITRGNAGLTDPPPQPYYNHGGGIIIRFTNATIANCIFTENNAEEWGGAIFTYESDSTVINSIFYDNNAQVGAGIMHLGPSAPIVTNCLFYNNSAIDGGGIANSDAADASITNCTFSGNGSSDEASHGGGIYNDRSDATIDNCIFWGNSAFWGPQIFQYRWLQPILNDYVTGGLVIEVVDAAGLSVGDTIYITDSSAPVTPESAVVDAITETTAALAIDYTVGGLTVQVDDATGFVACDTIYITEEGGSTEVSTILSVAANIITLNTAYTGSYLTANNAFVYKNAVITINTAFLNAYDTDDDAYIYNQLPLTVTYSDVQGGNWEDRILVYTNNIVVSPDFVGGGSYRLEDTSPCIDVGDNTAVPVGVTVDLDGRERIINGVVDMGAYEYYIAVPGTVQFSAPTYSIGEAGPTATITATRTGGSDGAISVGYATSDDTATAGSDYTATNGTSR